LRAYPSAAYYYDVHCLPPPARGRGFYLEELIPPTPPFKDTAGPSMNIFIKLISIVSLTFAPLFVRYGGIIGRYLGF
ncbi:K(+)-stimulated pyrophosphate-energized sodium pump, partial [Candidatus Hakubella thermalkaliphila]